MSSDGLVVVDINNVLVDKRYDNGEKSIRIRNGSVEFLERLLQKYQVGLWTSMMEETLNLFLNRLVDPSRLLFIWTRDRCLYSSQTSQQVIKPLELILRNPVLNKNRFFGYHNTVIVDDDPRKITENNPHDNCIVVAKYHYDHPEIETLDQILHRITIKLS